MYWLWGLFVAFVILLLIFDMGILHRRVREISLLEALVWSGFWLILALGFSVFIYFAYAQGWFGLRLTGDLTPTDAALAYLSVYLIALALNLDQAFSIRLIFSHFDVALPYQVRALNWYLTYALLWRAGVIVAAAVSLYYFDWSAYLLGALALLGALRLLIRRADGVDPDKHLLVRLLQQGQRIEATVRGDRFFSKADGKRMVSAVFAALLSLLAVETVYALTALPALFGFSHDPFLIFSATILASMNQRSIYFIVAGGLRRLRYLRITLVMVLALLGVSTFLREAISMPTAVALAIVIAVLAIGIFASLLSRKRAEGSYMPGFAQELSRVYDITYLGLRRIVILIIGISIIIIGLLMIFTPGPAIVVIPAGLAILATEFVWARIVLRKFKEQFVRYSKETKQFFQRKKQRKHTDNDREQ